MNRLCHRCLALIGLLCAYPLLAVEIDELLPVDEAFALSISAPTREHLALNWQIAEGYYLYRHRTKIVVQSGFDAQEMQLPAGQKSVDEFFGEVETYRQQLQAILPGKALADSVNLEVHYQGCADLGVCYPPQKRTLTVALPINQSENQLTNTNNSGFTLNLPTNNPSGLNLPGLSTQALPLPAEQAFAIEAIADNGNGLLLRLSPAPGYYLYRDRTTLSLEGAKGIHVGPVQWPQGQTYYDDHFGDVQVYFDPVDVAVPLLREQEQASEINLVTYFQGCQIDGICYPPMTRHINLLLPAGTVSQVNKHVEEDENAVAVSSVIRPSIDLNSLDIEVENTQRTPPPAATLSQLPFILLLALLGGLILNLMPCVLPVLSLKVLSLAQSGQSRQDARAHALWYTVGVLSAFTLVGISVLALRAAGQAAGWGFQLQQPWFVGALVYVMFAMGLSLSGVYTLGSSFLANTGQTLATRAGASGDFFTGVLACVVASPCIAPFMGPALAYAFAAPAVVGLLVFIALGLGLALPFLLIGFIPALAQRLPQPGAWMQTLKHILAFPMYFTAIWLLWILGQQRGPDAMALLLVGMVLLALGLWWFERNRWHSRRAGMLLAVVLMLLALLPLWSINRISAVTTVEAEEGVIAWSAEELARLRADNRVIFVNMTADWCITCKANERNVLDREPFRAALAQFNALYMRGDWTNINPQISAFLQQHNAVGVPLYVIYGPASPPQVLPAILTQSSVDHALQRAAGR